MSRIGKTPIEIPSDVSINISGNSVEVKGAKGTPKFGSPSSVNS